jgi:hypothetical protein
MISVGTKSKNRNGNQRGMLLQLDSNVGLSLFFSLATSSTLAQCSTPRSHFAESFSLALFHQ